MHVIQLARAQWLVIDVHYRPRFLIVQGPLVLRETGETHMKHRVEWWSPDPAKRHVLSVHDGMLGAETWCRDEIVKTDQERARIAGATERRGF